MVSKLLEGEERAAAAQRDTRMIRGEDKLNEAKKQPQENDERLS